MHEFYSPSRNSSSIIFIFTSGYDVNFFTLKKWILNQFGYAKQVFVFNIHYVDFEAFGILMNHGVVIQSTKDYALFSKFLVDAIPSIGK